MNFSGLKERKMKKWFHVDERTSMITGHVAFIFLILTQIALIAAFLYRVYGLGHDPAKYNDLRIILGGSILGYWFTRLYFGGFLAELSIKRWLLIYVILAAVVALSFLLLSGVPGEGEWRIFILATTAGPAVIVGGFALFTYLGRKRIEKQISASVNSQGLGKGERR
jgi:hypothetical protein